MKKMKKKICEIQDINCELEDVKDKVNEVIRKSEMLKREGGSTKSVFLIILGTAFILIGGFLLDGGVLTWMSLLTGVLCFGFAEVADAIRGGERDG